MSSGLLINGHAPADAALAIAVDERGLQYGDGLFETALLTGGKVRFLDDHLKRLELGCERLRIRCPGRSVLTGEVAQVTAGQREGVVKLTVTRGAGGRGYRGAASLAPTRIVALYPQPQPPADPSAGIAVRWCQMQLGRNAALAGMKHLNRLEQVLAQCEWDDPQIDEGLMLDRQGELVCATSSNIFAVIDAALCTPDLRYAGVRGVMRGRVLAAAEQLGLAIEERPLWPEELATATEVFVTNAVRGIRAVRSLEELAWNTGPITRRLAEKLALW